MMHPQAYNQHFLNQFFSDIPFQTLLTTFDMLDDTLVWVKDKNSRIVHANQYFVHQLGFDSLEQLLGKNDYEFSPLEIAQQFLDDDQKVLQGQLVQNRIELNILRSGEIGWFETSKFPLHSKDQEIIGTYGVSKRRDDSAIPLTAVTQLENALAFIRYNFTRDISVSELAEHCCISISALERRFKKYLQKSPKQFINEIRLEYGSHLLLRSNDTIANIALAAGFSDPNYFTRMFTRHFGCAPSDYRHQKRGGDLPQ
ncbi:AraC family transcriptional regulator [Halioxenophilus aromaticivorans]|uniref:HTH araC/xylS-type domain-containing protein n=1 Tax=Halioxenophilus aromaticivorans TaxID=1306992 RepID=A0AAV3U2N1_9ALTE